MWVQRESIITHCLNSMDLPVTDEQLNRYNHSPDRPLVQNVFPDLTTEQREFLINGITPEEWTKHIGD